jgi:hypothetical protein
MTVNTAAILDPALSPSMRDEVLMQRARLLCQGPEDLIAFAIAGEDDLLARHATPDGREADERFDPDARDLLDVLEAWCDDPAGAWAEIVASAEEA